MGRGLRRRLAVRFALVMAVALLAAAFWAYLGVRETLFSQLDLALRTTFAREAFALAEIGHIPRPAPTREDRLGREISRLVVIRDSVGRIVQANTDLARDLPLDSASLRAALAGERRTSDGAWRQMAVRSLYGPAPAGAPPATVLQVTASRGPLESASRTVLYGMVATALLGSLAALVGAGWLARSALAPVSEIAGQARTIQGSRRGQRITTRADAVELQALIEVLNQMLERLELASEWHRRIIRDLGHDLRTPITTLRAGCEMALSSERNAAEYRRVLRDTLEEVDRLALIGDALSFLGRLETGQLEPAFQLVDLRLLATQAVDRSTARPGGEPIRFEPPPDEVLAPVDPRLIGTVLDQLLDNARRHTPPGTPVEIGVAATGRSAVLVVEDQGPGVGDESLPHLFDRFYRGDPARGRQAGAGLGLAAAAAIIELHGGRIAASRGGAGGLRVRIELRRA